MIRACPVGVVISLAALVPAIAAGPYDGQWSGGSPSVNVGSGKSCPATTAKATVADGKLTGKYEFGINSYSIRGTIAPDGSLTGGFWGGNALTGKFAGDHFSGTYNSGLCGTARPVSLDRSK